MKRVVDIYTDGSTRGKNKKGVNNMGGFGIAAYINNELVYTYSEQQSNTTNNIEELRAIEWALMLSQSLFRDYICNIYSDSTYAINSLTQWAEGWERNGWRKKDKKPIENLELIKSIYTLYIKNNDFPNFIIKKVSGHTGIDGNELADRLAKGKNN